MCREVKQILIRRSRKATAGRRKWRCVVTKCAHGVIWQWWCDANEQNGSTRTLAGTAERIPVDQWPESVRNFLRNGLMPKPKTKRKISRDIIAERAQKAEDALAKWITKAKIAVGRVSKYTKQVAYYRKKQISQRRPIAKAKRAIDLTGELTGG